MERGKTCRSNLLGVTAPKMFALLLILCLVECATGSCLSYGHSCWGAHGKRSGKPPASAPDWYMTRLLRRMAANAEMNREKTLKNDDISAIYRMELGDDVPATPKITNDNDDDGPMEFPQNRRPDARPMLDDEVLSKMKIWQMMRESSVDK